MKALSLLVLFAALTSTAFADQCAYVSKASGETAVKLISLSTKNIGGVLELCQACGEKAPTQVKVNQIDIGATNVAELPSEVAINGVGIDLAYTYVNISAGTWVNLAMLSGCPANGVSQFILQKVSASGKVKFIPSAKY